MKSELVLWLVALVSACFLLAFGVSDTVAPKEKRSSHGSRRTDRRRTVVGHQKTVVLGALVSNSFLLLVVGPGASSSFLLLLVRHLLLVAMHLVPSSFLFLIASCYY